MKLFKNKFYIIGNRPQIDWQRVFILAVILIIIVSIYNALFYQKIQAKNEAEEKAAELAQSAAAASLKQATTTNENASTTVDKKDVTYIMELYKKREDKYKKALTDYTR
jgi:uncharacterized protein YpmB